MEKACPIVLRNERQEILLFTHPEAGVQLVKGTLKPGEKVEEGCVRELQEESGLQLSVASYLGASANSDAQEIWHYCLMENHSELPEKWEHFCQDNGGHLFRFFWAPISNAHEYVFHEKYLRAIDFVRGALTSQISRDALTRTPA